jgi:hypothetical protein
LAARKFFARTSSALRRSIFFTVHRRPSSLVAPQQARARHLMAGLVLTLLMQQRHRGWLCMLPSRHLVHLCDSCFRCSRLLQSTAAGWPWCATHRPWTAPQNPPPRYNMLAALPPSLKPLLNGCRRCAAGGNRGACCAPSTVRAVGVLPVCLVRL